MKFANVNGERREAQSYLSGTCLGCGHPMIARCGEQRVHHWAHKGARTCDPWWENETEWHRAWKGKFPSAWQEYVHLAPSGEKHIADVKTDQGWVLEFQHSYIDPKERRSRDAFYPKLLWVVDGLRRQRDQAQFFKAWSEARTVAQERNVRKVSIDECALLREWFTSPVPVFFDFGDPETVWWLHNGHRTTYQAYVMAFPRSKFIDAHLGGGSEGFDLSLRALQYFIDSVESNIRQQQEREALQQRKEAMQQALLYQQALQRRIAWSNRGRGRRF